MVLILLLLEPLLRFWDNLSSIDRVNCLNPSLAGTTSPIPLMFPCSKALSGLNPSLAGTTSPMQGIECYRAQSTGLNPSLAGTTSPILKKKAKISINDVLILLLLEPLLRFGKVSSGGVYFLKS